MSRTTFKVKLVKGYHKGILAESLKIRNWLNAYTPISVSLMSSEEAGKGKVLEVMLKAPNQQTINAVLNLIPSHLVASFSVTNS